MANTYVSNGVTPDFKQGVSLGHVDDKTSVVSKAERDCLNDVDLNLSKINIFINDATECRERVNNLTHERSKIQCEIDSELTRLSTLNYVLETLGYDSK